MAGYLNAVCIYVGQYIITSYRIYWVRMIFIITLPHPHKSLFLLLVEQSCAHNIMHRHIIILL